MIIFSPANFEALRGAIELVGSGRVLDSTESESMSSHYCMSVILEGNLQRRRKELITCLNEAGIGTSIYYPQPVPRMRYYLDKYGYDAERYKEATNISDNSVALPVGPQVSADDITYIGYRIKNFLRKKNNGYTHSGT